MIQGRIKGATRTTSFFFFTRLTKRADADMGFVLSRPYSQRVLGKIDIQCIFLFLKLFVEYAIGFYYNKRMSGEMVILLSRESTSKKATNDIALKDFRTTKEY